MKKLFSPSGHYLYLSIFRVYLALHVLQKLFFFAGHTDMLFGSNSFARQNGDALLPVIGLDLDFVRNHYWYFLVPFYIITFFVMFGIGRNFSIFLMYFFLEIFQRLNNFILNGGDNLLKFLILYMIFADSFRYLTIYKSKTAVRESGTANMLTNLAVLSVKVHLCLVYFISGIHKLNSKLWFSGVASYYTMLNERFEGTSWNKHIVQNGFFVTVSTYFVMLWEVFFPFLVNTKKLRLFTLITGVFIHAGIFIFMMIYDFEVLFVACYGFFYSDEELIRYFGKAKQFCIKMYNNLFLRTRKAG